MDIGLIVSLSMGGVIITLFLLLTLYRKYKIKKINDKYNSSPTKEKNKEEDINKK